MKENIELDVVLLKGAMEGGIDGYLSTAIRTGEFKTPDDAIKRSEWFKRQPLGYTNKVIKRIIEIENN